MLLYETEYVDGATGTNLPMTYHPTPLFDKVLFFLQMAFRDNDSEYDYRNHCLSAIKNLAKSSHDV